MSININAAEDWRAEDGRAAAVIVAERAAELWADAVRLQRWTDPDHADVYAIACELVATLTAVDDLADVLARQISGYGRGRALYDDTPQIDPADRLAEAVEQLRSAQTDIRAAGVAANKFWSAIGHIGVEEVAQ